MPGSHTAIVPVPCAYDRATFLFLPITPLLSAPSPSLTRLTAASSVCRAGEERRRGQYTAAHGHNSNPESKGSDGDRCTVCAGVPDPVRGYPPLDVIGRIHDVWLQNVTEVWRLPVRKWVPLHAFSAPPVRRDTGGRVYHYCGAVVSNSSAETP